MLGASGALVCQIRRSIPQLRFADVCCRIQDTIAAPGRVYIARLRSPLPMMPARFSTPFKPQEPLEVPRSAATVAPLLEVLPMTVIAPDIRLRRHVAPLAPARHVPAWWSDLLQASGAISIFLTAAWLQCWLDTYGPGFSGTWVHWEADGQLVGGCLLLERMTWLKHLPFRSVYLNATGVSSRPTPFAEYNDVLHLPGYQGPISDDLIGLLEERSWSRLMLSGYEKGGVCDLLSQKIPSLMVEHVAEPARYVDLRGSPDLPFESSLSGKAGTHVRRNHREFSSRLGHLTVKRAVDLPQAKRYFEQLCALHVARFVARGESTTLSEPSVLRFHNQLIEKLWPTGAVDILSVGSDERSVGFLYNFIVDRKVFVFQTGFDYDFPHKWSPGLLTHALAVESYRQRGMLEYDFLSGEALYKRSLANRHRELLWSVHFRNRPWVRLGLRARRLRNRWRGTPLAHFDAPAASPSPMSEALPPRQNPHPVLQNKTSITESSGVAEHLPLVSVVIPSFNSAGTIAATIESVLAQTYPHVEIVVVDDGSTDMTSAVLAPYSGQVLIVSKPNGGLASARNAGCAVASGEYIVLLDADDLCMPERVGVQVHFMHQHPEVLLCSSEFGAFDHAGTVAERFAGRYYSRLGQTHGGLRSLYSQQGVLDVTRWLPEHGVRQDAPVYSGNVYSNLTLGNFIHPPTVMFRQSVLAQCGPFDESIRNVCDWEWFVRVARRGIVGYIDRPLLRYRQSESQLSGQRHKLQIYRDVLSNLERFCSEDPKLLLTSASEMRRSIGNACINVADAVLETDRPSALAHLGRAARLGVLNPEWLRAFAKSIVPRALLRGARRWRHP